MPGNRITRIHEHHDDDPGDRASRMSELLIEGARPSADRTARIEWRVHERGLHVDTISSRTRSDDAHLLRDRREQRDDDEGDLE